MTSQQASDRGSQQLFLKNLARNSVFWCSGGKLVEPFLHWQGYYAQECGLLPCYYKGHTLHASAKQAIGGVNINHHYGLHNIAVKSSETQQTY